MTSSTETITVVKLNLNSKEALWLKSHMQNYHGENPHSESEEDRRMREKFFEAIPHPDKLQ